MGGRESEARSSGLKVEAGGGVMDADRLSGGGGVTLWGGGGGGVMDADRVSDSDSAASGEDEEAGDDPAGV